LAYVNSVVRAEMVEQSRKFEPIATSDGGVIGNATGSSRGFFGDLFKLAGGNTDIDAVCRSIGCEWANVKSYSTGMKWGEAIENLRSDKLRSPVGGLHGAPLAVFGIKIPPHSSVCRLQTT
jgi:hypothetical protein